jgi:ATP-binding cassette subfamily F protein 3
MQIAALEARQQQITAELEKPETYEAGGAAMNLNRESMSVSQSLERLTAEWEVLSAQNVEG